MKEQIHRPPRQNGYGFSDLRLNSPLELSIPKLFMSENHGKPLSETEEKRLGEAITSARNILRGLPPEQKLTEMYCETKAAVLEQARPAIDKLLEAKLELIYKYAVELYLNNHFPSLEEALSYTSEIAAACAYYFDPNKGRFSAFYRGSVMGSLSESSERPINIKQRSADLVYQIYEFKQTFLKEKGRAPSTSEVADSFFEGNVETARNFLNCMKPVDNLDDYIEHPSNTKPLEKAYEESETTRELIRYICTVIDEIYGDDEQKKQIAKVMMLEEAGLISIDRKQFLEEHNITPKTAIQIKAKLMDKLRKDHPSPHNPFTQIMRSNSE